MTPTRTTHLTILLHGLIIYLMSDDVHTPFSKLTGARQTMRAWARVIETLDELPDVYKSAYQALTGPVDNLPYTVLVPAQGGPRNRHSSERLLSDIGDAFYILERAGSQMSVTGYAYPDIDSLEIGNILLYSWFSIHGRTRAGDQSTSTIEFNESNLRHLEPFFSKMRPLAATLDLVELNKFNFLASENFKFMNLGRENLVAGEKVFRVIYQPARREPVMAVLGCAIYHTVFEAHLVVMTDQEIIFIDDAEKVQQKKRSEYGGVRRFLPLHGLTGVILEPYSHDLLGLTLQVAHDLQVQRLFDASRRAELEELQQAIEHAR